MEYAANPEMVGKTARNTQWVFAFLDVVMAGILRTMFCGWKGDGGD